MRGDELARDGVVLADDLDQLLRLRGLGECGEPTQVEVRDDEIGSVSGEELLSFRACDQLRDLRRDEAGELGALALHGFEQPGIRDRNRCLIGERLDEGDVLLRVRFRLLAHHA